MKTYRINKIFSTIQGEGKRTGEPMVFIRFSGCNLKCPFCDTDHEEGRDISADDILDALKAVNPLCKSVSLCGGEPSLQVDSALVKLLKMNGYKIGIETNGTNPLPAGIDYVVVSPKTKKVHPYFDEHPPDELRFPIKAGDPYPLPPCKARILSLSPIFDGDEPNWKNIKHTVEMCKKIPTLHLNIQAHKFIGVE